LLGTAFALMMIQAQSALDIWWQISGIFGGGILGLFILALSNVRLKVWQGLVSIGASIVVISWGTFIRDLPAGWQWLQCGIEEIIIGALGTVALLVVALIFHFNNKRKVA
jgi:solute:Na+ symporter, SSS family